MEEAILKSMGFYIKENPWTGKKVWAWGQYTMHTDLGDFESPIIEWDEATKRAYSFPLDYEKTITTRRGLERLVDSTSFLMSTES